MPFRRLTPNELFGLIFPSSYFNRALTYEKWSKSMSLRMSMSVFPEVEILCFAL